MGQSKNVMSDFMKKNKPTGTLTPTLTQTW